MDSYHTRGQQAQKWTQNGIAHYLDPTTFARAKTVQDGIRATQKLQPDLSQIKPEDRHGSQELALRIWASDTYEAARILKQRHTRVAALNMAHPRIPGGALLSGSRAQEEVICMRSTLYQSLSRSFYPLRIPDVICSPDVLVCKGFDGSWIGTDMPDDQTWFVDVISAAAVEAPRTVVHPDSGLKVYADPNDRQAMVNGILSIVKAAVHMNASALVLGAWGCGMFGNPIQDVASIMKEVIFGPHGGLPMHNWAALGLTEVVIAIYDKDHTEGYPVWNGFINEFTERPPLPPVLHSEEKLEICRVLRWPVDNQTTNPGKSSSLHSNPPFEGTRPGDDKDKNKDDHDSPYDDSGDDGAGEADRVDGTNQAKAEQVGAAVFNSLIQPLNAPLVPRPRTPVSPIRAETGLPVVSPGNYVAAPRVTVCQPPRVTQTCMPTPPPSEGSEELPDYESPPEDN